VHPLAELGLDLVRHERAWHRLPHWDPRLWQPVDAGLECGSTRDVHRLSTLGVSWAKRFLQRSQHKTASKLTPTRPSHGRPQRSEDGRKGGGTARAGSAHSARRQATTLGDAQRHAPTFLPSTRARAEQAGGGHKDDVVNNPTEIRDWRIADEWPAGAKPVTRKIQYDDLYRVKRLDYEYAAGDDDWTSPFAAELAGSSDPRRAPPSPHVSFSKRILWQTYNYDWLGNTSKTDDDAQGFYDRSLGTVTNDTGNDKPYQLRSASNQASGGTRAGKAEARYDAAGNLTRLDVERNGPSLVGKASHRLDYAWDEVGRLVRARRWDVLPASLTTPDAPLPTGEPDADLEYVYDASDDRVLKTAHADGAAVHTAYVFDTLELRRTTYASGDYSQTTGSGAEITESEVPYLFGHGVRLARVVYEQVNDGEPRLTSGGRQHVFFELGDHLGSTSVVLDKETSELVERGAFQAYGAKESDYRAARWAGFREDYGFTGKEEDVEVGLAYFGKRFLSPYLGRWVSADPLEVHAPGQADANLYAYVRGQILKATDPLGLTGGDNPVKLPDGSPGSWDADDGTEIGTPAAKMSDKPIVPGSDPIAKMSDAQVGRELDKLLTRLDEDKEGTLSVEEAFPHGIPGHIEAGDYIGFGKGLWNAPFSFTEWAGERLSLDLDLSGAKFDIGAKEQSGAFLGENMGPTPVGAAGVVGKAVARLTTPTLTLRLTRVAYLQRLGSAVDAGESAMGSGANAEGVARSLVAGRNDLKLELRAAGPWLAGRLADMRNLVKYGNRAGPTADQLLETHGTWEGVVDSVKRTSKAADRLAE
jgi:RHS repeat-associated protein